MSIVPAHYPEFVLLHLIPSEMRDELAGRLSVSRFGKGRSVTTFDSVDCDVFFLVEGRARVTLFSNTGREVAIHEIEVTEIFGEIAALDGYGRSASIVAMTDLRLIRLRREDFLMCLKASPDAAIWLAQRLASVVRRLTDRVFELSALPVQSRLHCELLRMAGPGAASGVLIEQAPTHAELANRIGASREAVTREMRRLADVEILRQRRRTLEFLDLPRLEQSVARAIG
jgi:CRP-like cAMP-binding protein